MAVAVTGKRCTKCGEVKPLTEFPKRVTGPYDTRRQAADSVRHIYNLPPGTGAWAEASHRLLCEALGNAGVQLGAYDHTIVQWICGFEPETVAVIAGLISRAGR